MTRLVDADALIRRIDGELEDVNGYLEAATQEDDRLVLTSAKTELERVRSMIDGAAATWGMPDAA